MSFSFLKIDFTFNHVYMSVCMWVCVHECRCPQKPKALDSPAAGVTGGYEGAT